VTDGTIDVVGGVYIELCIHPAWNQLLGSAGRAARALSAIAADVRLHTYVDESYRRELEALTRSLTNTSLLAYKIPQTTAFHYVHPLSIPVIVPAPYIAPPAPPIAVRGDVILRFGILEGDAIVHGERVVYDPQSAYAPVPFGANGSTAKTLAIVANGSEIRRLSGTDDLEIGARTLLQRDGASTVVIKRGSAGALVITAQRTDQVPAYRSESVFSIGSGDVFAAAFSFFWGLQDLDAVEAADLASRTTARYCESRDPFIPDATTLRAGWSRRIHSTPGKVYLAGPFFTIAQRWLVEEARTHLRDMGLEVFSPLHDVGRGTAAQVAPQDLAAFDSCDRVLALVDGADPGTIFEVGFARARGLQVIALSEALSEEDLKMIEGSGCERVVDFATALYFVAWCR
jgi:hypothetical protein